MAMGCGQRQGQPHRIVIKPDMEKRAISSWASVKPEIRLKETSYFFDAFKSGQAGLDSPLGIVTPDWTISNPGERVAASVGRSEEARWDHKLCMLQVVREDIVWKIDDDSEADE